MTVIALVRCNGRVRRKPLTVIFVTDTCVTRSIFTSFRLIDKRYSKCQYKEAHIMHMFVYLYGKIGQEFNFGCLLITSTFGPLTPSYCRNEIRWNFQFNWKHTSDWNQLKNNWVTQLPWNASAEIKFFKNILEHRFSGKTTKSALFTETNYDALKFSFP